MITGKKIPFINENLLMKNALKIMSKKNLGVLIVRNSKGSTVGIISDGDLKRLSEKNENIKSLIVKKIMKPYPISVEKNMLAVKALSIMNSNKITCLCVHKLVNNKKTIGLIHVHNILEANLS